MIQLSGVSKSYSGQSPVLNQVSLKLNRGDFLYVLGGSGTGKTSLLKLLATEEPSSAGIVSLFGYSLTQVSPSTLRAIRQIIGYIPQDIQLIPDLSVSDNVAMSLFLGGRRVSHLLGKEARHKIDDLLERLGLKDKRNQLACRLSGGEAQRVAIARAMIRSPELVIADEPTGSQDKDHIWAIMDLLLKANLSGATIVLATHDREIIRRVRKPCASLHRGRLNLEEATACTF